MPVEVERREIEVTHAGPFASDFSPRVEELWEEQDHHLIQSIAADIEDADMGAKIIPPRDVLAAAFDVLSDHADEYDEVPDDPARFEVRSVDVRVDEPGSVSIGVYPE